MNKIEFNYVAGYYYRTKNIEIIKAGFLSLECAQKYIANFDTLSCGFPYVVTPEGKYIYGYTNYHSEKMRWYSPAEWKKAIIYDCRSDECLGIDSFLPIDQYYNILKQNK